MLTPSILLEQRAPPDIGQWWEEGRYWMPVLLQVVPGWVTPPVHHAKGYGYLRPKVVTLALTQSAGRTGMVTIVRPRSVIRRKDNQCIFFQPLFAECSILHRHSVQFHHDIAIQSLLALSFKLVAEAASGTCGMGYAR